VNLHWPLAVSLLAALAASPPPLALAWQLADTGQESCYRTVSPSEEVPCPDTGQDGAYVIAPMRFADNGDGTVSDLRTGLTWQRQGDGAGYYWYEAAGVDHWNWNPHGTDVCGDLILGGKSDWRLPTRKELAGLLDLGHCDPTLDPGSFPSAARGDFWSSSLHASEENLAWHVDARYGMVSSYSLSNRYNVLCVRGPKHEARSFTDLGDGTVSDLRTGLQWQQGEPGTMAWAGALKYCRGLALAGTDDWRLPNARELESLVDASRAGLPLDPLFFPGASAAGYWSSTSAPCEPVRAVYVDFASDWEYGYGALVHGDKASYGHVRCVRGGEVEPAGGSAPLALGLSGHSVPADQPAGTLVGTLATGDADPDDTFTYALAPGEGDTDNNLFAVAGNLLLTAAVMDGSGPGTLSVRVGTTDAQGHRHEEDFTLAVVSPATFTLPDTSQTTCWRPVAPYEPIPCPGSGQDGAYAINPMRYTAGTVTVADEVTGLVWQRRDDARRYNWYQASGTPHPLSNPSGQDYCGSLVLGGQTDWRLPDREELVSILHHDRVPAISPLFLTVSLGGYWTADGSAESPLEAWQVSFTDAAVTGYESKTVGLFVRCVRGTPAAAISPLADNGDGTVTDRRTGLTWQQGEPAGRTWKGALGYCHTLSLGGHTDWRLPNVKELISLADPRLHDPALAAGFFPGAASACYLSSTNNGEAVWSVDFRHGQADTLFKADTHRLRCVRGGAPPGEDNLPPADLGLSPGSVAENLPSGTPVGTLTTVDPDEGDTFTYQLVPGEGDGDNASFLVDGDLLLTAVVFDFEVRDAYQIRLRSTDGGGLSLEKALVVAVTDQDETPSLTVLKPNGGETWRRGRRQTISWRHRWLEGTLTVDLLLGRKKVAVIRKGLPVGASLRQSVTWKVPGNLALSDRYLIQVSWDQRPGVRDRSNRQFRVSE
jgi:hypothetical protein